MKKTAVEWLCEQYYLKQDIEIVKQAKEMESQQKGYSEEEVIRLLVKRELFLELYDMANEYEDANEWFKQFKK